MLRMGFKPTIHVIEGYILDGVWGCHSGGYEQNVAVIFSIEEGEQETSVKAAGKQSCHAGLLLGSLFDAEDIGDTFFKDVSW
jgi:hypothetical protein